MDIWLWIIAIILVVFGLFSVPLPYIQIGKKVKKSYKWTRGFIGVLREKMFINDNVVEHFNYFIEEFQNFVRSDYKPSFTSLYAEIRNKAKLSKMEEKHIQDEIERRKAEYYELKLTRKLNRRKIFRQTVSKFAFLVIDTSKMARSIATTIKEKNLDLRTLEEKFVNQYRFTAKEFNNYLRYFRSFLDRTHCYHGVEIEHYKLLDLLIPEELSLIQEKVGRHSRTKRTYQNIEG